MLFDLRRRGRRKTVKVIYVGLAGLMAVGLVGFGIGTGANQGGIINAFSENNKGGGTPTYEKQVKEALERTHKHPTEADAWEALAKARLSQATGSEYSNPNTGVYTSKGKELLEEIASDWREYLTLEPKNPSPRLANDMFSVFGQEGLNEPAQTVRVLQIIIASKPPSEALYADLAEYAFQANQLGEGELAAEKAVSLAPKTQRKELKKELEGLKIKSIEKLIKAHNPTSTTTTSTTTPSSVLPSTTG